MDLTECIKKGLIIREKNENSVIFTEIDESEKDLKWAKKWLELGDTKGTIEKSYYSMFHMTKALLFDRGYREKGTHICLLAFLEELEKEGKIKPIVVQEYRAAMKSREEATYHYSYSSETAKEAIKIAGEFNNTLIKLITSK